ncbi:phosphatidylinositol-glycan biosynthesis class F protein [Orussus abietinus]|uniref:phosphatidylinositol-glycan biosynthesis class F protein n=1 Tax=Orussus abietinus TaxID=222816 RepID=UPI000625D7EF|nr:phosphatidylinositol-glycan biosynthesis class F protein [Orussus abietinus]XP_012276442.1 phosphatidylinositol-glycan biosynthesis class F protein [Orussus abietinus]
MGIDSIQERRLLLFYSSFTCIYFSSVLTLLKLHNNLDSVRTFKCIPILIILMFSEALKFVFLYFKSEQPVLGKLESRTSFQSKKTWMRFLRNFIKFIIISFTLSIIYYITIVLFGAPMVSHFEETATLTITLTVLTFVLVSSQIGVDEALFILCGLRKNDCNLLTRAAETHTKVTLLGAWLGAIVIPLDWDRPWQSWPIPCVIGALLGYTVAHSITAIQTLLTLKLNKKLHR